MRTMYENGFAAHDRKSQSSSYKGADISALRSNVVVMDANRFTRKE